ncbi:hypothetical protein DSO57_1011932 [Entomophthora muscae]|uniref:Uncharacterized protein n=1 Tax=Entomophthora muscae TaxID=34485 RepID=A0ACC2T6L3_9FUNG|nr:hypothetical protein DSO57_1011932 [Entomophthora muscae]
MFQPMTAEGALWADFNPSPTREISDLLPHAFLAKIKHCRPGSTNDCLHIKLIALNFQPATWTSYFTQCIILPCHIESFLFNTSSWEIHGPDVFPRFQWRSLLSRLLNLNLPEAIHPPEVSYTVNAKGVFAIWFKSIELNISAIYQTDTNGKVFQYPFTAQIPLVTEDYQINGIFGLENICSISIAQIWDQSQTIRYEAIASIQKYYCKK